MNAKTLILMLSLGVFSQMASAAETPTRDEDIVFECIGREQGISGRVRGGRFTEYAQRSIRVYKTPRKSVFLVKDGVYDGNTGLYIFDEEWPANERFAAGKKTFAGSRDPRKNLIITRLGFRYTGEASENRNLRPGSLSCEENPY